MRKFIILLCIGLIGMLVIMPALAQEETPQAEAVELEPWTCPPGFEGQTLQVYNWTTYVAEDTYSNFQELCGLAEVVETTFGDNEALLADLSQGNRGFDIIVPSDYMISIMIAQDLLEPLNKENIPNLANLSPDLLGGPYDPENTYSVPYQWGTIGIGYNKENVGAEITTWQEMFEYGGNVAWLEDKRNMLGIALNMLGYDPNTTNPDEVFEAAQFLIANGSNVRVISPDLGQADLERGDVDMAVEYSGDIFQLMDECECDTYDYVIPAEGSVLWTDNLAIPKGAPNKELAEVFIDYILDPQVGADISNFTAYGTPNQVAIDAGLIDEELLNNPAIYPPEEVRERLYFLQEVPEVDQDYTDAWDAVTTSVG